MAIEMFSTIDQISGFSAERLIKLVEADKEGRVVMLPCKVGDTVYVNKRTLYEGWRTKGISAELATGKIVSFRKNQTSTFMKIKFAFNEGSKTHMNSYVLSAIGRTVFLTREEAEDALAKEVRHEAN